MNVARNHMAPFTRDASGGGPIGDESPIGVESLPAEPQAIDWRALRSRLFASHDRLGVLGEDAAASRLRLRGSFDGCAASALNAYDPPSEAYAYQEASTDVNLDASSNGKPHGCKDFPVADVNADVTGSGERG